MIRFGFVLLDKRKMNRTREMTNGTKPGENLFFFCCSIWIKIESKKMKYRSEYIRRPIEMRRIMEETKRENAEKGYGRPMGSAGGGINSRSLSSFAMFLEASS